MPPRIGYIGTFNYLPNRAGVEWFIRSVWPRIKREVPTVHLRLVGEGSDRYFSGMGADIEGLGWVSDPSVEIASWSTMIVPLHIGAGTRVKIAEAFSRKCPVVSTSLGAFGYLVPNGEDLLLADNAQDFASACVLLIKNPELGLRISKNAWKKFLKSWAWDAIGASVSKAVEECVNRSNYELSQSHPVQADK
jgi:glycosyltransferase involved in cell wall biosynthesis